MKWFGKSWGAPICDPDDHRPTPLGEECLYCKKPIGPDDIGLLIPHLDETASIRPWHHACFMASITHDPETCPHCQGAKG